VQRLNLLTCADVVPIWVVRCELLVCTCLDDVDPRRDLKFTRTLEVRGVCGDESLCAAQTHSDPLSNTTQVASEKNIPDVSYSWHFCERGELPCKGGVEDGERDGVDGGMDWKIKFRLSRPFWVFCAVTSDYVIAS
jgi:hypothetical protein